MRTEVIVLAAGEGKRMNSALPKVLHPLAGKPLLQHVLETALSLQPEACHVVTGAGADDVQSGMRGLEVNWVQQSEQLGTGHAVLKRQTPPRGEASYCDLPSEGTAGCRDWP